MKELKYTEMISMNVYLFVILGHGELANLQHAWSMRVY